MRTSNRGIVIIYLAFLVSLLIYGAHKHNVKQSNIRNVPAKTIKKEIDPFVLARENQRQQDIKRVKAFLHRYKTPLENEAQEFVDAAYFYKLDYKLLVAITGVESTFCKFPAPGTQYNCWGFKSYSTPNGWWRFSSYREGIWKIAQTIGTENCYAKFREDKQISTLATSYSEGSESWINSINYFISEL